MLSIHQRYVHMFRLIFRVSLVALFVGVLGVMGSGPVAQADSTFHTERIPLLPVHGATLRTGFVVDIHANGPVIYAHENYVLNGAVAHTAYVMQSLIYVGGSGCTAPLFTSTDAQIVTNAAGNGQASNVLSPAAVGSLHGITLDIVWQVVGPSGVAYQTPCVSVPLD